MLRKSRTTAPCEKVEIAWGETDEDVYIRRITDREVKKLFPTVTAEGEVDWHATFSAKDGSRLALTTDKESAIGLAIEHECTIHTVH
ncbi:hypothetical protein A3A38_03280 [Candidatus Kaiserbacteria bacterium RIFCSPLOWO2_01_FULL_53_17]|uniref:DUF1150 domain-containing protein n=1 Tax=Candidatus Kaiserbacteria bacterium RIFCSPLOWO2_01_FULL_53_17 TaxID=1798511 RepID=A0A1F6EGY0_9BACT|nr:MAG: hypothetical protein A3A38_03280 [Candidatus Kaiserbacteria bacterium RIFCSPLOWO2_01_FULL_53_17]